MSGMEHVEDVTAEQLQAQNGGPTLHSEAGSFLNAKANKEKKKATVRLRDTLVNRRLAVPLLVLIARLRNTIIFQAGNSQHLKLTALLCDQCSLTFVQLQAFLERHLAAEDYDKMLPSIKTLCGDYHLQADAAYFLTRSRQRRSISQRISELGDKVYSRRAVGRFGVAAGVGRCMAPQLSRTATSPPRTGAIKGSPTPHLCHPGLYLRCRARECRATSKRQTPS